MKVIFPPSGPLPTIPQVTHLQCSHTLRLQLQRWRWAYPSSILVSSYQPTWYHTPEDHNLILTLTLPQLSDKFRLSLNVNVNSLFILQFLYIRINVEQAWRVLLEQNALTKHVSEIALFVPADMYSFKFILLPFGWPKLQIQEF